VKSVEILDFQEHDRSENIRRLGFVASRFSAQGIVTIISAINPYDDVRRELVDRYDDVNIVHVDCPVNKLISTRYQGPLSKSAFARGAPRQIAEPNRDQ
jgi:adenylylsulfate kinase